MVPHAAPSPPGTRNDECLSCRNFRLGDQCISSCNSSAVTSMTSSATSAVTSSVSSPVNIYQKDASTCAFCHSECVGGCTGPDANHCHACKVRGDTEKEISISIGSMNRMAYNSNRTDHQFHKLFIPQNVKDGPYCVSECPQPKYNEGGVCRACHKNCVGGCQGPENNLGPRGCNSCEKAVVNSDVEIQYCLHEQESCPTGYFPDYVQHTVSGDPLCWEFPS